MTISINSSINNEMSQFINKRDKMLNSNARIQTQPQFQQKRGNDSHVKHGVAMTTAITVFAVLAGIAKHQGFKLNPKTIFSQNPKEWALFKYQNLENKTGKKVETLNLEEKEIVTIAGSSIIGGLIGGRIFDDKSQFKAKIKESVSQMLGDVLVPLTFVAVPSRWYQKHAEKVSSYAPQIKNPNNSKGILKFNKVLKGLPAMGIMLGSLCAGIVVGNRVSNFINEKVFHKKVKRNIRVTDFAPHLDDICLASTLMSNGNMFGKIVSRFVPFALMVAGNEVGIAKEDDAD
ncbi:MAG: hypothetical protein LKG27_05350 [Clostridiaceae bacterium]|jgi:hypothetical protein|nr:hypothetical protein [Clostridiaceae bacterium]